MSEKVIKPNVVALAGIATISLIISLVGIVASLLSDSFGGVILFMAVLIFPFYKYATLKRTEYAVTDEKVTVNVDFGGEKHEEAGFNKIQNTSVRRPFFYQLVGEYGNINISTAGSNANALEFEAVENPKDIHQEIVKQIDDDKKGTSRSNPQSSDMDNSYEEYRKLREASEKLKDQIKGDNHE